MSCLFELHSPTWMTKKERKKERKKKPMCPRGSINVLDRSEGGNDLKKGYIKDKEKVHDDEPSNFLLVSQTAVVESAEWP